MIQGATGSLSPPLAGEIKNSTQESGPQLRALFLSCLLVAGTTLFPPLSRSSTGSPLAVNRLCETDLAGTI